MKWNIRVSTAAGVFDLLNIPSKDCKMSHGKDGVPIAYAGNPVIKRKAACDPKVAAGSE
jgi:hypothetical protein